MELSQKFLKQNSKQFQDIPLKITTTNGELKVKALYGDFDCGLLCISFQLGSSVYANALINIGSKYDTKLLVFCASNTRNVKWEADTKTLSCTLDNTDDTELRSPKALLIK